MLPSMAARVYSSQRWREVTAAVLDRDGWICQLCGERIPRHVRARDPLQGVADHITPADAGGDWYELGNLRAAHYGCNSARATRQRHQRARLGRARRRRYPPQRRWF